MNCTVMVGLPATGKSSLVKSLIGDNTFIYSTDTYIEEQAAALGKSYNDIFQDYIDKATVRMNLLLELAIARNCDIIWDQTNLVINKRRKIISRMTQAGYNVNCVAITAPNIDDYSVWYERLASRVGKTIPEDVLNNMVQTYMLPSIEEDFDMITYYDMYGTLLGIDYKNIL
jgi:predicted kinase